MAQKRKRVRFVLCGTAVGTNKISDFRLIAANNIASKYDGSKAIRVNIPDDLQLTKYTCDPYSTTDDDRTLIELGYDLVIWNKSQKKWIVHNEYKGIPLCDIRLWNKQICDIHPLN